MKNCNLIKGYILVILSAFLFGCVPLIARHIYAAGINRESAVLLRNFLALPVLALLTWREGKSFQIPLKTMPMITAIALTGCCITPLLLYGSYQHCHRHGNGVPFRVPGYRGFDWPDIPTEKVRCENPCGGADLRCWYLPVLQSPNRWTGQAASWP